ncbi:MAG: DUF6049 family protein [Pseudoclavibacter sp.]|nr:DUF6049 family protein [Pseudoclavibacter sp.]
MDLASRLLSWVRRIAPRAAVPVALLATLGLVGFGVLFLARPASPPGPSGPSESPAVLPSTERPLLTSIEEAPPGEVTLVLAPRDPGGLAAGEELVVDAAIVNRSERPVEPGELVLRLALGSIDTRFALSAWMNEAADENVVETAELGRTASGRIAPGRTASLSITVPPGGVPFADPGRAGPRGISAELLVGGQAVALGRSSIVWTEGEIPATPLAVVVPLVPPLSTDPVLDADELAELTAPEGQLALILDAVQGTSVVLGVDPRILLSIRALGDQAPASAVAWLSRLAALPNDSFALPYGDADLALQAQAGLNEPVELDSLDFLPEPRPSSTQSSSTPQGPGGTTPAPSPTPSPSPTDAPPGSETGSPSPTSASPPDERPGYEELTAFPHDFDGVLLPAPGTLAPERLDRIEGWGYERLLVDSRDVAWDGDPGFTPDAHARVSGRPAMIADAELSAALSEAGASGGVDRRAAAAAAAAILSTVARELPNEQRTQLAVVDREAVQSDPRGLAEVLRAVHGLAWTSSATLSFAADEALPDTTLLPGSHDEAAVAGAVELMDAERRADALAAVFDEPRIHRSEARAALVQALSTGWNAHPEAWAQARGELLDSMLEVERAVSIGESSEIHVVGHETQLPVFVKNETAERVTVRLDLRPTTGHIEAAGPVTITVEAESMARAIVPIRVVTNGRAGAEVSLATPEGVRLNAKQTIAMTVSAELETVLAASGAAVLGLGVVWGVVQTIRKRRAARAEHEPTGVEA